MIFWRVVLVGTAPTRLWASAASDAETQTTDFSGWLLTFRAYQITYPIARETSVTHSAIRRPIPSPMLVPAASEATPVAKGLTVEPTTPAPARRKMIAAPTIRS